MTKETTAPPYEEFLNLPTKGNRASIPSIINSKMFGIKKLAQLYDRFKRGKKLKYSSGYYMEEDGLVMVGKIKEKLYRDLYDLLSSDKYFEDYYTGAGVIVINVSNDLYKRVMNGTIILDNDSVEQTILDSFKINILYGE